MNNQKGVIHLVLPLLLLLIIVAGFFALSYFSVIKLPSLFNKIPVIGSKQATASVKEEYKNPFDKKSQFVNPFDQYKSPLLNLEK